MKFTPTPLEGAYVIEPDKLEDSRGFFARLFGADEFKKQGLETTYVQSSISFNKTKDTLRGMHYQKAPHEEVRLVRCTKGKIYDVIIDVRPQSKTYKKYFAIELSEENRLTIYVPKAFAHGFITLEPNCEVNYWMSVPYHTESSVGVRFDDPTFNITWPSRPQVISERDSNFPNFS